MSGKEYFEKIIVTWYILCKLLDPLGANIVFCKNVLQKMMETFFIVLSIDKVINRSNG